MNNRLVSLCAIVLYLHMQIADANDLIKIEENIGLSAPSSDLFKIDVNEVPEAPIHIHGLFYAKKSFGNAIGHVNSYQTIGAFIGASRGDIESFIDMRGHNFGDNKWGANCGLGLRYLRRSLQTVFGINGFYDFRNYYGNCNQLGIGLECLGKYFDLTVNYYVPIDDKRHPGKSHTYTYPGGYYAKKTPYLYALSGGDIEIGTDSSRLFSKSSLNLYTGVGGYHYNGKNSTKTFSGFLYRAELNYGDLITIGLLGTSDAVFHNKIQGYIQLNLPFDECGFHICNKTCCHCCLDQVLDHPVRRNPVIMENNSNCCSWETNY